MIGTTLSHYKIIQPLGKGGMGEVYLADDLKLKRKVALKVLPAEIVQNEDRKKRFVQEARAAAAIEHPNIAAIYDVGEADGLSFIAMEYVRGRSLTRLLSKGKLGVEHALQIAGQIADALAKVHGRGVVHRDLKPDNVLISEEGYVKIIDFGLAKLLETPFNEEDDASENDTASMVKTRAGVVMGTVLYMSPEQARGAPVDSRSDIFSFGILLYQLLTGETPFKRSTQLETLSAILRDPPPPMKLEARQTPKPKRLEKIVKKALAKDRDERYQDFRSLASELTEIREGIASGSAPVGARLRLVTSGLAIVLVLALIVVWFIVREPPVVGAQEPISVLVADFDNGTGEELFDGALEQAMAIGLEGASFVTTYSRADARKEAGRIDPSSQGILDERLAQLVCRGMGIKVAVAGAIESNGDDYAIRVRALDPVTSKVITEASETEVSKADVLRVSDRLATQLRRGLGERSAESTAALEGETFVTASLEAMKAYADGQALYKGGDYEDAIDAYRKAIAHDPEFGRAYSGIASNLSNLGHREEALRYYELALTKIDRMTERGKHRTRGSYYLFIRDPDKALEEFEALVEKFPADTAGQANLALAYFFRRDMTRALEVGKRSIEIYPNNLLDRNNLALYAMYAGDFETTKAQAEQILELNPAFTKAYVALALAQSGLGELDAAQATYRRMAAEAPSALAASTSATGLADVALFEGRLDDAVAILERGLAGDRANENSSGIARKLVMLAQAHLQAGRDGAAVSAAREAAELTSSTSVLVPAARVYLSTNHTEETQAIVSALGERLQSDPRAYAKLLEGEMMLEAGDSSGALRVLKEAQGIADTWHGRYLLGRAYLASDAFVEAHSELELCVNRRGEATALFLDDVPSYHYFPPVHFYLGQALAGLGSPGASESFQAYAAIREKAQQDPLLAEARRHLGSTNVEE